MTGYAYQTRWVSSTNILVKYSSICRSSAILAHLELALQDDAIKAMSH